MRIFGIVLALVGLVGSDVAAPSMNESEPLQMSMNCGIAPIPPIGCRVGQCVCNGSGSNCRWTFVCN